MRLPLKACCDKWTVFLKGYNNRNTDTTANFEVEDMQNCHNTLSRARYELTVAIANVLSHLHQPLLEFRLILVPSRDHLLIKLYRQPNPL